jgi:hypothetical protein
VPHACIPSFEGNRDQDPVSINKLAWCCTPAIPATLEVQIELRYRSVLSPPLGQRKKVGDPTKSKRAWGMVQVIKHLPANPNTTKKKKKDSNHSCWVRIGQLKGQQEERRGRWRRDPWMGGGRMGPQTWGKKSVNYVITSSFFNALPVSTMKPTPEHTPPSAPTPSSLSEPQFWPQDFCHSLFLG